MKTIAITNAKIISYIDDYKKNYYIDENDDSLAVEEILLKVISSPVLDGEPYLGAPEQLRRDLILKERNMRKALNEDNR